MKPKEWFMCGRKKSFSSKRVAGKAIERIQVKTRGDEFANWRVYECPKCHCFHLTTTPEVET